MATMAPSQAQVKLQLTSRDPTIRLPEGTGPILVNTDLRRYALSTLVNHLLETPRPIPLEFLINGTVLRTSIDDYLKANGLSAETTLTAEYIRAQTPPAYVAKFLHDDWVTCVDVLSSSSNAAKWSAADRVTSPNQERILSGSYDGLLRLWNPSSTSTEPMAISPSKEAGGARAGIKTCKFLTADRAVSSGHDNAIRLWKIEEDTKSGTASLQPKLVLVGHDNWVQSLDVHGPSQRILSASYDNTIGIWSTEKHNAPAAPTPTVTKKRKIASSSVSLPRRAALAYLSSHTQQVTAVKFDPKDHTVCYSTSWDDTLRTWDLTTESLVDTRTLGSALWSLCALPEHSLVAVGTDPRHITLVDMRASATKTAAMTLRGHVNTVVALQPDPGSSFCLVSGSQDSTCRLWDIRATHTNGPEGIVGKSTYMIRRDGIKHEKGFRPAGKGYQVFDVCWNREVGIVSASEDKTVQINQGTGVAAATGSTPA